MQIVFIVDVEDAQAAERLARELEAAGVLVVAGPRLVPSPLEAEGVLALSVQQSQVRDRSAEPEDRPTREESAVPGHHPAPRSRRLQEPAVPGDR
jgi:hypothetical protein